MSMWKMIRIESYREFVARVEEDQELGKLECEKCGARMVFEWLDTECGEVYPGWACPCCDFENGYL